MDVSDWIGINWIVQKWNQNPSFHQKFLITIIYGFYAVLIFTVIIIVPGKLSESNGESKIVIFSMSLGYVTNKWGNFTICLQDTSNSTK